MALRGTIKDFGIADIFQLIGQQAKTGVLVLNNDVDEIHVYFREGSVVFAENMTRPGQMLLGSLMVRAGLLTQSQLDRALDEQRRTLKRIGNIVIDSGLVDRRTVVELARLQMTETIYSLFEWKVGTYQFDNAAVEPSPDGIDPIRAENIVMNGIRMVDEWPSLREQMPSYAWRVERVRDLPDAPRGRAASISDEFNLAAFDDPDAEPSEVDDISRHERSVYALIEPGSTVQEMIDRSRLGEFEALKSLCELMNAGFIRVIKPTTGDTDDALMPVQVSFAQVLQVLVRVAVTVGLVLAAFVLVERAFGALGETDALVYTKDPVERRLANAQLRVLARALEVYRLQSGRYPSTLDDLVDSRLLLERDLRFPFERRYYYRVEGERIELLPPIY